MRAILLHDEMRMELEPWPAPQEEEEEEETECGPRNVIVAIGPTLEGYDGLLESHLGPPEEITIDLDGKLLSLAETMSGEGPGGPYYKAHVEHMQRLVNILRSGGSIICDGSLALGIEQVGTEYPEGLFAPLDAEWQRLGNELRTRSLGLLPPVLAVVLRRCKSREQVPDVLRELRNELSSSRSRVWNAIGRARSASSVKEGMDALSELDAVAAAFISGANEQTYGSIRIFWEIFDSAVGAIAGLIATGHPIGVIAGASAVPILKEGGKRLATPLLNRGSIDLGRRLGREFFKISPSSTVHELSRILGASEKIKLGF